MPAFESKPRLSFWVTDNEFTPEIVRTLWRAWAAESLPPSAQLFFSSEHTPQPPHAWGVSASVGRRLFCMTHCLEQSMDLDMVFVVDANLCIQADILSLYSLKDSSPMLSDKSILRDMGVLVYFPQHPQFNDLLLNWRTQFLEDYEVASQWQPSLRIGLPTEWLARLAARQDDHSVVDLRPFTHRPWLNAEAPFASKWLSSLQSIGSERVELGKTIEEDISANRVRRSLLPQWEGLDLSAFEVNDDRQMAYPEWSLSADQVQRLRSPSFQRRMKTFRLKAEKYTAKASGQLPMSIARRVRKKAKKSLHLAQAWRVQMLRRIKKIQRLPKIQETQKVSQ